VGTDEPAARADRFAAVLSEFGLELDWTALGNAYCEGEGAGFFGEEDRQALFDAGLHFASDLATALEPLPGRPPATGPGRSLYVGAALAELTPLLCEVLVLGREVEAFSLDGDETRELNRALAAVAERLGLRLPRIRTDALETGASGPVDHLWLVSVLNDPDAFPALHDELYDCHGNELATGRGELADDLARADELVSTALATLAPPALLTTTDEELALVGGACARRGWTLDAPDQARLSAIVGDAVRVCRVAP
jgi:hypothetical protein